jgi:hypothetical protein
MGDAGYWEQRRRGEQEKERAGEEPVGSVHQAQVLGLHTMRREGGGGYQARAWDRAKMQKKNRSD